MKKPYHTSYHKDFKKILALIAKKREEKKISQWDLGEQLGLSESGYFRVEKGTSKLDMIRFLQILSILEISPSDFFKDLEKEDAL